MPALASPDGAHPWYQPSCSPCSVDGYDSHHHRHLVHGDGGSWIAVQRDDGFWQRAVRRREARPGCIRCPHDTGGAVSGDRHALIPDAVQARARGSPIAHRPENASRAAIDRVILGAGFTVDALLATMARDKKTVGGRLGFVLATRIGRACPAARPPWRNRRRREMRYYSLRFFP